MKLTPLSSLVIGAALLVGAGPGFGATAAATSKQVMPTGDAKKLAARYALTKTRIDNLLSARLHPVALPTTSIPNPFYKPDASIPVAPPEVRVEKLFTPEAPDLSDADTLAKYANGLKIGGYLIVGGSPHVAISSVICKVGDVVTVGSKDHPVFLRIESITPLELTLSLNEASYVVPLRK